MHQLVKKACVQLRAAQLPPAWAKVEATGTPRCNAYVGQIRSLMEAVDGAGSLNPKTKANTKTFPQQFGSAGGGRERLHALVTTQSPSLLDL